MAKFKNEMGIGHIEFEHTIKCFCTIGKTLCTYIVFVEMEPTTYIPDYLEIQEALDELNNHWYTLEAACAEILDRVAAQVENEYNHLKVVVSCYDARHFPAKVEKERRIV